MRILLADDNAEIRAALRLLLEELGEHDIVEATDGAELLSTVENDHADVILLDWELPDVSSSRPSCKVRQAHRLSLIEELKRKCGDARVIVMSSAPEAEQSSRRAGCDGFVSRHEPPDRLLALLRLGQGRPDPDAGDERPL